MKTSARALGAAAILLATVSALPASAATLVTYNFAGQPGNQASVAAATVATGLAGDAFTRGPGLSSTSGSNSISAASWSTAANDYFEFGFDVLSGFTASVDQLVFTSRSSNTGPGALNILRSIDGGAFSVVGSFTQNGTEYADNTIAITPSTIASNVVFRIVAANTTSADGGALAGGGTFRIGNFLSDTSTPAAATPFAINGSVSSVAGAVPEPAAWGLMILGFGAVGASMRRKAVKLRLSLA